MTSNSIPLTTITFDIPIMPQALRKLRGAVIESVMQHKAVFEAARVPTHVFHNHKEQVAVTSEGEMEATAEAMQDRSFDYPQVQYQVRHRKAQITGIGQGAQALQLWLSLAGNTLTVNRQEVRLAIRDHRHEQWQPALKDEAKFYRINKWLPFSPKNFDQWKQTPRLQDKAAILDELIWGHVCHMGEGLGFELDRERLQLFVSTIDWMGFRDCYGIQKQALDITFCTNLNLPEEIGLGQGSTIGFGKVQSIKKTERRKKATK